MSRAEPAAGSVIARRSGEEIRFIDLAGWRGVEIAQELLAGDTLRTNERGHLAILFADDTQMRMGRNTTLVVKKATNGADSEFLLEGGTLWARAGRGGTALTVQTPAAAAAIRGTDWTLQVGDGGNTTLSVFEGIVELSNAQGSVTVRQGEGAFAAIGQAPRKYILVNLKEREQILLYGELRSTFAELPVSGLGGRATRAERLGLLAIPESARNTEDWLALAEASLAIDGRAAAETALGHLRRPLPSRLEARARLVEAMIAGQERRFRDAAILFEAALPSLPPNRRGAAAYGRWFAQALAEPDRRIPPPPADAYGDDPVAEMARAIAASYTLGPAEAIKMLRASERRFPNDARLPAMRADLAFQLDRRDEVAEALALAKAIDPDEPAYLLVSARYKSTVFSQLDEALSELERAVEIAPGADAVWNEIGIVQGDRNAVLEAEAAYEQAVALNPENPALRANHARFLMDNDRLPAAKIEIEAAETLDAHSYAVLAAKGRYLLRMGKTEEGRQVLLEASAVNPAYGDSLIGLAVADYQLEDVGQSEQALDNADRFDPSNPSIPLIRSGIALDQYRADDAIEQAREALRRRQQRGGFYTGYDPNRQAASFLGVTLNFLEMDEWGQYYADRSFDPFRATSYLDEAADGRINPVIGASPPLSPDDRTTSGGTTFSSQLQGLLFDPLAVASQTRRNSLERRAFFEGAIGGGPIWEDGKLGWKSDVLLQGTSYAPLPLSYYLQAEIARPESPRANDRDDLIGANFQIGMRPTLADSVVLFGNTATLNRGFPGQVSAPTLFDESEGRFSNIGTAWSHILGDRNLVQAFAVAGNSTLDRQIDLEDEAGPYRQSGRSKEEALTLGVGHMVGTEALTVRYGAEASLFKSWDSVIETDLTYGYIFNEEQASDRGVALRAYADAFWEASQDLWLQGGLHLISGDGGEETHIDPRLGIAWSPKENHWLRGYYRHDTQFPSNYTLSPISIVGLTPLELPLFREGQTKTLAARWDAEWTERFFTSLEYQHQTIEGLSLDIPDLLGTFDTASGRVDRFGASANYWIGSGLAAFASYAWNDNEDLTFDDKVGIPLVPDYLGRVGLTFVHPSKLKATIAQTFVGPRESGLAISLAPYTTTDFALSWQSDDGHLEWGLQVLNAFDNDHELTLDVPGPGRTILGTIRAKF